MFEEMLTVGGRQFELAYNQPLTIEQKNQTIEQIASQFGLFIDREPQTLQGTCVSINTRQAGQGIGLWTAISTGTLPYTIYWFKFAPGVAPAFPPTGSNLIAVQPNPIPYSGNTYNYGYIIPVTDGDTPGNWTYGAYITDGCIPPQTCYQLCTVDVLPVGVTPTPTPTITPTPTVTPTPTGTPGPTPTPTPGACGGAFTGIFSTS